MEWELTILVVFAFAYLLKIWSSKSHQKNKGMLPPGPRRFPIIGNLHLLGKAPHRNLQELAKKYGPIMYMRFGFVPVVVISSPQAAEQILKTHDLIFASRPSHESSKYVSYDQRNLAYSSYGPYWRQMRKLCTLELLIPAKIVSFKDMRKEEVGILVEDIKKAASACTAVDVSAETAALTANIICRMVFGKKFTDKELDDRGFKSAIREGMRLTALPNIADYIPQLARFDLQGFTKRYKAISKVFDGFFEEIIDEHMASSRREKTKDFVDTMLEIMASQDTEFSIDRPNIKAIILDMLAAGMDTSATSVEWVMSELVKSPSAMKKLQKELETIVGLEKMVEETDLESLKYLDMVVKETLRLHPPGPLMIPHKSIEECTINGFYIPKNCTVMVNVWTIGRDPNVWNDAEKFLPERFVGSNIDLRGHDFQLIPFGSGRRGCPGMQLGLTVVRLVVAQLVHCFNWELPDNMQPDDLDMVEEFGLTIPRAKHLSAIPTYRLNK